MCRGRSQCRALAGGQGQTIWLLDSSSGYIGNYVQPPMWAEVYLYWPGWGGDARHRHHPSQRHMGDFVAAFLAGNVEFCDFKTCFDVGPESRSLHWGALDE